MHTSGFCDTSYFRDWGVMEHLVKYNKQAGKEKATQVKAGDWITNINGAGPSFLQESKRYAKE